MCRIPPFNLRIAALAEAQMDHRLAALPALLFYAPLFVTAKGWLQPGLLCIDTHLMPDGGELPQVDHADALQVGNPAKPPVFVFILWQYADIHQYIYHCCIASASALAIHGGIHFGG